MSRKDAATLKKGDKVWRTYDPLEYRVTRVKVGGGWGIEVSIQHGRQPVLVLSGVGAVRSLRRAR